MHVPKVHVPTKISLRTFGVILLVAIAVTGLFAYQVAQSTYTSTPLYLDAIPSTATYVVEADGAGNFRAIRYDGYLAYDSTNDDYTIQYAINQTTSSGGLVYVKSGSYSASVVLKDKVHLIIEEGATGITVSVNDSATCQLWDHNAGRIRYFVDGAATMDIDLASGTITPLSWDGSWNSTVEDVVENFAALPWKDLWNATVEDLIETYGITEWQDSWNVTVTDLIETYLSSYSWEESASYIVFEDSGVYKAKNCSSGQIDYSSTNASYVILSAWDAMTEGTLYLKSADYPTDVTITLNSTATHKKQLIGEGKNTVIKASSGSVTPIVQVTSDHATLGFSFAVIRDVAIQGYNRATGQIGLQLGESGSYVTEASLDNIFVYDCDSDIVIWNPQMCDFRRLICWNFKTTGLQIIASGTGMAPTSDGFYSCESSMDSSSATTAACLTIVTNNSAQMWQAVNWFDCHFYASNPAGSPTTKNVWFDMQTHTCQSMDFWGCLFEGAIYGVAFGPSTDYYYVRTGFHSCVWIGNNAMTDGIKGLGVGSAYVTIDGSTSFENMVDGIHLTGGDTYEMFGGLGVSGVTNMFKGGSCRAFNIYWDDKGRSDNFLTIMNTTATTFVFNHGLISNAIFVSASFNSTAVDGYSWASTSTQITITITGTSLPKYIQCYCYCKYVP
jgi:hypothetical protein